MQIEKLEYFLEVARTGSINQAAQNLNISHQALNQAMHLMEKELGVKLFEGNRKGTSLTINGELVRGTAETIVEAWSTLRQGICAANNDIETIKLGFIPYYEWLFYAVQRNIKSKYPHISLVMQNMYYSEAVQLLLDETLDLAFTVMLETELEELLLKNSNLEYIPLKFTEYDVLVNARSPLAVYEYLQWEHLNGMPVALMKLGDSEKNHLTHTLQCKGLNILFVHTEPMLHELVAENEASYFISKDSLAPDNIKGKTKRIAFHENLVSVYGILCRKDSLNAANIIKVVEMIKTCCK